jgi:glucose-6-phosphate 1-dehydrogenase
MTKLPGINTGIAQAELDLSFQDRFKRAAPEAYAYLLRDVMRGDHSLFVRADELDAAWQVFTPMLQELESSGRQPIMYKRGVRGLPEGDKLLADAGYVFTGASYQWKK